MYKIFIAEDDEISNEGILRFVVDAFWRANLLDITLIHDYDGIGHG